MRFLESTSGVVYKVLLIAALVAVLLPTCAMPLCGPVDGAHMGGGMAGLLDCQEMYYPSDAPAAVVLQALVLLFAAVLITFAYRRPLPASVVDRVSFRESGEPPEPPDDPLRGRLII